MNIISVPFDPEGQENKYLRLSDAFCVLCSEYFLWFCMVLKLGVAL
jgi:hypothetical protein